MSVGRGRGIDFFFEIFPAAPKFYDFALYQREGVLGENPFSHGGSCPSRVDCPCQMDGRAYCLQSQLIIIINYIQ